MRPGFYALASLDGQPLPPPDLETLALHQPGQGVLLSYPGFAVRAWDPHPGAVDTHSTPDSVTLFAGFLDEPEDLRAALAADPSAGSAALAGLALERFGPEAPRHLLGEWTLLRWHPAARKLTLLTSEALRDGLYLAEGPGLLAICPHPMQLTRLSWTERALDARGFATNAARAGLRHAIQTDQTMWKGIRSVRPGTLLVFTSGGCTTETVSPHPPPQPWAGTYDEAVEALQAVGRHIVAQHMDRHPRTAFLLSGGLDSTLLTSWGAFERNSQRELFCLSSMAPPGSRLPDEKLWSTAAAAALGVSLQGVWPAPDSDLYHPPAELFAEYESAPVGPYNVILALEKAARAGGATAIVDGSNGEMHVSNGFEIPETRSALRIRLARARDAFARRRQFGGWPSDAFHLKFSHEFLHQLPPEWEAIWRKGPPAVNPWTKTGRQDPPAGISPVLRKMALSPTASGGGLRHLLIYRDLRLVRLAAQLPASFFRHDGQTRPLARSMLQGRVPDSVRLRTQGRPFAPDYVPRLTAQAPAAAARIPLYRESGVGRWLDLDSFAGGLQRLAASQGEPDYGLCYATQSTAIVAELLLWLTTQGVSW